MKEIEYKETIYVCNELKKKKKKKKTTTNVQGMREISRSSKSAIIIEDTKN